MLKYLTCPKCHRTSGINVYRTRAYGKLSFDWSDHKPTNSYLCEKCLHVFTACVYVEDKCKRCKLRVDCLTLDVTAHVKQHYLYETSFTNPSNVPVTKKSNNYDQPPVHVMQTWLLKASPATSIFSSICPKCGGVLPVSRDRETMEFLEKDRCLLCGQEYIYMDIEEMREKYG